MGGLANNLAICMFVCLRITVIFLAHAVHVKGK
jgi:hypothetical protein